MAACMINTRETADRLWDEVLKTNPDADGNSRMFVQYLAARPVVGERFGNTDLTVIGVRCGR